MARGRWIPGWRLWTTADGYGCGERSCGVDTEQARAAHLAAVCECLQQLGPRACAAGATAALAWGWSLVEMPALPRIAVPRQDSHVWLPGADLVRTRVRQDERTLAGLAMIPATTPARTVRDLARDLPLEEGVAAVDSAVAGDPDRLRRWRQQAQAARGPFSGRLRRVLSLADARAESVLESLGRVALARAGVGPLLPQYRLAEGGHPYDLYVGDGARTLIEFDGATHRETARFLRDLDDGLLAVGERYLLIRVGYVHVRRRPLDFAGFVERAVADQRRHLR